MREPEPIVRSQNSALRDLLPFYSVGHAVFSAILLLGIYLLMLWFDAPTAPFVALGSFVGVAAVGTLGKPAWMLVGLNQVGQLEVFLARQKYQRDLAGDWVPPLPWWLRWNYNRVRVRNEDGAAFVTGPATVLRGLATELSQRG